MRRFYIDLEQAKEMSIYDLMCKETEVGSEPNIRPIYKDDKIYKDYVGFIIEG